MNLLQYLLQNLHVFHSDEILFVFHLMLGNLKMGNLKITFEYFENNN